MGYVDIVPKKPYVGATFMPETKPRTIKCKLCGAERLTKNPRTIYCVDCARKKELARNRRTAREAAERKKAAR